MLTQIISFAMSIASKGLKNKNIDLPTKQLRALSCFGYNDITKCHHLKKSNTSNYHFCNGCGCGDKNRTWLLKDKGEYSKLDFPVLNCPLKMPGFTNYDPNYFVPENKTRKQAIENFNPDNLKFIEVTVNFNPMIDKVMDDINKISKNS